MIKLARLFGFVVLAISILGCGTDYWSYKQAKIPDHVSHPRNIPVWLDQRFTPAQDVQIEEAVNEWNGVFNGQIVLKLQVRDAVVAGKNIKQLVTFSDTDDAKKLIDNSRKTDLGWVVIKLTEDDPAIANMDSEGVLAFVTGADEHFIGIMTEHLGERVLKDIVLHEMGHLLGAVHVMSPSLMYPVYGPNQTTCIDKTTVLQVANFWHLDPMTLNYCKTPEYP